MNRIRLVSQIVSLTLVILLSAGCNSSQPVPTLTQVPPTATVVPTVAATLSPEQIASLNPSPRGYVSMAYDSESDRVILFGGQTGDGRDSASYNSETWAYDLTANKWTQMKPASGPTGRAGAELAYDTESDRVILFGGGNETPGVWNDTWAYDYNTNTWSELAKGPEQHMGTRIVYDSESDRIILFGGHDMVKSNVSYNEIWAYDFNSDTWVEMKPSTTSPSIRNNHAMTYDAASDRVIMWGGENLALARDDSVWLYDFNTNTWQEMRPGNGQYPLELHGTTFAYDAESNRTIFIGGIPILGDDTWVYDNTNNTWEKLTSSTFPTMRSWHAMAYNSTTDRMVLFGGVTGYVPDVFSNETWTYDYNTNTWTNVTPHP